MRLRSKIIPVAAALAVVGTLSLTPSIAAPIDPPVVIERELGSIRSLFTLTENRITTFIISRPGDGAVVPGKGGLSFEGDMSSLGADISITDSGDLIGGTIGFGTLGPSYVHPGGMEDPKLRGIFGVGGDVIDFGFTDTIYEFLFRVTSCGFHPEVTFSCNVNDTWAVVFTAENLPTQFGPAAFPGGNIIDTSVGISRIGVVNAVPVPAAGILLASVVIAGAAMSRRTMAGRTRPIGQS